MKQKFCLSLFLPFLFLLAISCNLTSPSAPEDYEPISIKESLQTPVYTDTLALIAQNWSWGADIILDNAEPIHDGTASIAVTINSNEWGGLYLYINNYALAAQVTGVHFWIHGGTEGGQTLAVKIIDANNGNWDRSVSVTPQANTWTEVTISLSQVGNPATIGGMIIQDNTGEPQPTFYVDDITLLSTAPPREATVGPSLSVDVAANRHPISPYIYGMNFADETLAQELHLPVNRRGGNATTRYNWQLDVYNTGSDWFFENIPADNDPLETLPNGSTADHFVEQNLRTGTETIITVPLIGWVAKQRLDSHPYDCGFKVSLYGGQQSTDPYDPDCGNGLTLNGENLTGNAPTDTSLPIAPAFVQDWLTHLTNKYGLAANGGVKFYSLDNEPMLWPFTHRDVHPDLTTYDEIRDRTFTYAPALKAVDPTAQTLGPVVWGWCAYFYSAADECSKSGKDYKAHGREDFIPWYLQQMAAYEQTNEVRILDYLDIHIYPQMEGVYSGDAGNYLTQAGRLRSTRQLWDSSYTTEDWINTQVALIPRMKAWVNENYPGTKTAITEYNWGALGTLNGALAQADILGIFGREGLDLATLWGPPSADQPGAYAFRMFLNYDGQGGMFGETSIQATSTDQDRLAIYAAQRTSDNALTLLVINKSDTTLDTTLTLANFTPTGTAAVYRYSADNLIAIIPLAVQTVTAEGFTATFPPFSITLFVIP
ncbi:MAG: glycoside hydrolase family 44 protein [Anaerolineales bacterium]|nr:glycoside hydrolase family 44 protein [Anaerolineales bacterium]